MTNEDFMTEMVAFTTLKKYDVAYANGIPLVSDYEYDIFRAKLKEEYPNHEYWGTQISSDMGGDKQKLPHTLGSLTKVKADGSCNTWLEKNSGDKTVSAKLDGVSLYLSYVKGNFDKAFLRGDGEMGYDVTKKAEKFVAWQLVKPVTCEVRAEAVLTHDNHLRLGYKTRRNGVAGLLNPERTSEDNLEKVRVFCYELISCSEGVADTERKRWHQMEEYGFQLAPFTIRKDATEESLAILLREWKESYPFDMDGLVVALNDSERDDNFYPENKVAFKVNEEATPCDVVKVVWSVGRTGRVTPVVWIVPTLIGGVTVEKATGFNFDFIRSSGIDAGAKIGIYRSGDVIPYIDTILEPVDTTIPMFCPSCGADLIHAGVDLKCEADDCKGKLILEAEYFLRTLGVEEVTATTLKKLDITDIYDCYELEELEIAGIEGFGIRRAEQIIFEINKSLKTTPDKFLAACGLRNVGLDTARTFLKEVDFDEYVHEQTDKVFTEIDGIGPVIASSLVFGREKVAKMYQTLLDYGLEWATATNNLRGKIFCMTGNGPIKRDVLVKMIESNGGYVKGMSKKVDYLVTKDPNSNSGKAKKAREYGTKVIGYEELIPMLEM